LSLSVGTLKPCNKRNIEQQKTQKKDKTNRVKMKNKTRNQYTLDGGSIPPGVIVNGSFTENLQQYDAGAQGRNVARIATGGVL
jgi:hypothetical protein